MTSQRATARRRLWPRQFAVKGGMAHAILCTKTAAPLACLLSAMTSISCLRVDISSCTDSSSSSLSMRARRMRAGTCAAYRRAELDKGSLDAITKPETTSTIITLMTPGAFSKHCTHGSVTLVSRCDSKRSSSSYGSVCIASHAAEERNASTHTASS